MASILCVDDEPAALLILRETLTSMGHQVTAVRNVNAAFAVLERGDVDLIISDFRMPEVTGLEFLQRLGGSSPTQSDDVLEMRRWLQAVATTPPTSSSRLPGPSFRAATSSWTGDHPPRTDPRFHLCCHCCGSQYYVVGIVVPMQPRRSSERRFILLLSNEMYLKLHDSRCASPSLARGSGNQHVLFGSGRPLGVVLRTEASAGR